MKLQPIFNILFGCLIFSQYVSAETNEKYAFHSIPEALLNNADAVVRDKSIEIELVDFDKIVTYEKFVITILKESAKSKGYFTEYYSKMISIGNIDARVYDKNGKRIKKIRLEDIDDYSAISDISLYEDYRVKFIDPQINAYPYTVEYTFERKYKSAYYLNNWYAFEDYNTSVEKASCTIITPPDYKIKWKEKNLSKVQKRVTKDEQNEYRWELNSYPAPRQEPLSAPIETWGPMVLLSPTEFDLDGYEGSIDTWANFGKFTFKLNQDRDELPQKTLDKVAALLTDEMSDYDKISAIYKYAQDKNRYINIAIGIGGLQPFPAKTVDELSYGDCKALSNYTASLLRAFGYQAYYTLVHAGNQNFLDPDFVKDYFNHIIVSVPVEKDTIWLECTSSYLPAGYLADFTDDRHVLLIKEEGGELVKTPGYSTEENNKSISGNIKLYKDGSALADYTRTYRGANYGDAYNVTLLDNEDRRKSVINSIQIPHFNLVDYQLEVHNDRNPSLNKSLKIRVPSYFTSVGDKYFFKLNLVNELAGIPPYSRNRSTPLFWERNYSEDDSITYELPDGFVVEALPEEFEINTEFGSYFFTIKQLDNQLIYKRHFEINKGEYPKEKYNDFIEFLEKIVQADKSQVVIVPDAYADGDM